MCFDDVAEKWRTLTSARVPTMRSPWCELALVAASVSLLNSTDELRPYADEEEVLRSTLVDACRFSHVDRQFLLGNNYVEMQAFTVTGKCFSLVRDGDYDAGARLPRTLAACSLLKTVDLGECRVVQKGRELVEAFAAKAALDARPLDRAGKRIGWNPLRGTAPEVALQVERAVAEASAAGRPLPLAGYKVRLDKGSRAGGGENLVVELGGTTVPKNSGDATLAVFGDAASVPRSATSSFKDCLPNRNLVRFSYLQALCAAHRAGSALPDRRRYAAVALVSEVLDATSVFYDPGFVRSSERLGTYTSKFRCAALQGAGAGPTPSTRGSSRRRGDRS